MIQIYVFDRLQNLRPDPERILETASGISFDSRYPKGYGPLSFTVRRKSPFAPIPVDPSDTVRMYDGTRLIYDGLVNSISKNVGNDQTLTINCVGWWNRLVQRKMAAIWVDEAALTRTYWRNGPSLGDAHKVTHRGGKLTIQMTPASQIDRIYLVDTYHGETYRMPEGQGVLKVDFDWHVRTGEESASGAKDGLWLSVYNYSTSTYDYNSTPSSADVGQDISVTGAALAGTQPQEVELHLIAKGQDPPAYTSGQETYDANDFAEIKSFVVYGAAQAGHSNGGTWTYSQIELIEDIIRRIAEISNDMSDVTAPTQVLNPYSEPEPIAAAEIIENILLYGDSNDDTYGGLVWGRDGTSDALPRFITQKFDTSDYEYQVSLSDQELTALQLEQPATGLHNYIMVKYTDEYGREVILTPTDDSDLKDTDAISTEMQRDHILEIGTTTQAIATQFGKRYLSHHKNRRTRGSLTLQGEVRTKQGAYQPVTWMRAGERIYDRTSNQIFFIRQCNIDIDNVTATVQPDLPIFDGAHAIARIAEGLV